DHEQPGPFEPRVVEMRPNQFLNIRERSAGRRQAPFSRIAPDRPIPLLAGSIAQDQAAPVTDCVLLIRVGELPLGHSRKLACKAPCIEVQLADDPGLHCYLAVSARNRLPAAIRSQFTVSITSRRPDPLRVARSISATHRQRT